MLDYAKEMMQSLESLYRYSDKLNRDLLFHFSFVLYVYNSEVYGVDYVHTFFDLDRLDIPEDAAKIGLVGKVGAYINHEPACNIVEKLVLCSGKKMTVLEVLFENCSSNQLNLKQGAFRVIKDAFSKIGSNQDILRQYNADKSMADSIFELVMQNWEFPIKGFANAMEDVFDNYLTMFPTQEDRIQLMKDILTKYPCSSRRKYASLRLLLKSIDVDAHL